MYKFTCKDLGLNCDYTTCDETRPEVMQAAMKHAITSHAELTINFSMEQSTAYLQALEAAVQPEGEAVLQPRREAVFMRA